MSLLAMAVSMLRQRTTNDGIHADLFGATRCKDCALACRASNTKKKRKEEFHNVTPYKHPLPFSLNHALATVPLRFP